MHSTLIEFDRQKHTEAYWRYNQVLQGKDRDILTDESLYLKRFLDPIKVCRRYKPKFGQGNKEGGLDLAGFMSLYGADP